MPSIPDAVAALGPGPITEQALRAHIHPLFSRVVAASQARGEIYLANHSLGRPLDALTTDLAEFASHWHTTLDAAWGPWLDERQAHRARLARLLGCARPDAVIPKTSAGQALRAVLNALPPTPGHGPHRVVTTRGEFDSIDHILKAAAHKGRITIDWVEPDGDGLIHAGDLCRAITPGTHLVVVSQVLFVTGQLLHDLPAIIARAHAVGALVMLDTYHSLGVVPVQLDTLGPDFAMGGCYKYLRGGPGGCFLAVHPRHLRPAGTPAPDSLFTTDTGWFAKAAPFSYDRADTPALAAGGDAWLESTEPVATSYQCRAGLELTLALGVDRLRAYSLEQQAFLADQLRSRGVPLREISPRGAFLLVPVADAKPALAALSARGVNADARPDTAGRWSIRLCPDILNTQDELADATDRIAAVLGC
jgi:kynureninase